MSSFEEGCFAEAVFQDGARPDDPPSPMVQHAFETPLELACEVGGCAVRCVDMLTWYADDTAVGRRELLSKTSDTCTLRTLFTAQDAKEFWELVNQQS